MKNYGNKLDGMHTHIISPTYLIVGERRGHGDYHETMLTFSSGVKIVWLLWWWLWGTDDGSYLIDFPTL